MLFQYMAQRPISGVIKRLRKGEKIDEGAWVRGRRRLLNLPFAITVIDLATWLIVPAVVIHIAIYTSGQEYKGVLFVYFRTFMIGIISSTLAFFLLEDYIRRKLIPIFFPKGRLAELSKTFKLPVRKRIRLLYMSGTSVPMFILVGSIFLSIWNLEENTVSAHEFGREILLFTITLSVMFVLIAFRLNHLVGRSVSEPLAEIIQVVKDVRNGNFSRKIQVMSNDEIGMLGDAGNEMIAALSEREKIRETFGKYVTPEIRDEILADRIPLDGERRQATVLFSDLRGFTSYCETNTPEEVVRSMREYFTAMQRAIRGHRGLVLQYVGDEVEAVFGVPIFYPDHADRAVSAALDMHRELAEFNRRRMAQGKVPFGHGIGVHTGEVLAGNTGSSEQLSYTLIGDAVNLGSRIQELTRKLGADILVSEETVKLLKNPFRLEKQIPQTVKGYSKPITVYVIADGRGG